MLPTPEILELAARTRLLVLDVDGVLTDGLLHYGAAGEQAKSFHVRDGAGIKAVLRAGINVAVISGRDSPATAIRMRELGVQYVLQNCADKLAALHRLLSETGNDAAHTACIGDDIADVPVMKEVALPLAVADAHPSACNAARWVTRLPGGFGAVREVCDLLLRARGRED
jgi:3-deoxy-D-manno-octulosonate 8-phosphate phosphatase (KDO 8-P phosphatase)